MSHRKQDLNTARMRKSIKAMLASRAAGACADVFNDAFRAYAREIPKGSTIAFLRWYREAFRREIERWPEVPQS